tara:strand:- start:1688 stop:2356 length:669 start_codon:yes stop_codon:yes gene_type:complete
MELYDTMRTTFAARDYTGDVVSDAVLYKILENARFAPSGGNRQGNRVIVVRDPAKRKRIAELVVPAAKRYTAQGKAGEGPWNSISPPMVTPEDIEATPPPSRLTEPYTSSDVVLVIIVDLKVVASTDQHLDRVGVISGASIYPFAWNILMAARHEGCGGTITTLAAAAEPEIQALFNIPTEFAVAAVIPLGRPVKQLTKLKRLPVEEMVTREQFDGEPFGIN